MDPEIVVLPNAEALARAAAQRFVDLARKAVQLRGWFSVALSGGSTPGRFYRLLAMEPYRARIPWGQVHLFWGDERCVPPDDPGSNYRLANETLIAHVPLPPENVQRIPGELDPQEAATQYDRLLRRFFAWETTNPRSFDLVLLGLGDDGHTASLFPGSAALSEMERLAVAVQAHYQDRPAWRVTLTLPAINAARQVLFLVIGRAKAKIVQAVLEGTGERHFSPQRVQPTAGRPTWLLDADAASRLNSRRTELVTKSNF